MRMAPRFKTIAGIVLGVGVIGYFVLTQTPFNTGRQRDALSYDEAAPQLSRLLSQVDWSENFVQRRAKIQLVDWDADGDLDLLRNTENTGWYENIAGIFTWQGDFPGRKLAGHSTAPVAFDWNEDGELDLLVGAEDGHIYCYHRAALDEPDHITARPYGD